jgi:hypothetical protein
LFSFWWLLAFSCKASAMNTTKDLLEYDVSDRETCVVFFQKRKLVSWATCQHMYCKNYKPTQWKGGFSGISICRALPQYELSQKSTSRSNLACVRPPYIKPDLFLSQWLFLSNFFLIGRQLTAIRPNIIRLSETFLFV